MFVVASRPTHPPGYITDLYHRLPVARKKLVQVDGGVYWMLSHPGRRPPHRRLVRPHPEPAPRERGDAITARRPGFPLVAIGRRRSRHRGMSAGRCRSAARMSKRGRPAAGPS